MWLSLSRGPRFELVAHAKLCLRDVSEHVNTFDLELDNANVTVSAGKLKIDGIRQWFVFFWTTVQHHCMTVIGVHYFSV